MTKEEIIEMIKLNLGVQVHTDSSGKVEVVLTWDGVMLDRDFDYLDLDD